jgi:hypothetical protein
MQYKLRRKDRVLSETDTRALLERGEYGVLSLCCAAGEPYGLPLSYCVLDTAIYFHCTLEGLVAKYSSSFMPQGLQYIGAQGSTTRVFKVSIENICGKAWK